MRKTWRAVAAVALLGAAGPAAAGGSCAAGFQERARALVQRFVDANLYSGAILVAVDGKPVLREGVGLADREWNIPNTPDTKFRIGSNTKQFTATAILQLAQQGKLSIDDPISKYYAEAPPAWDKVTIKTLLDHTSGIPSYTAIPGFFQSEARLPHTPEALIKLTRDKPLEFEPGSKYAYDNSGYILLGYVIEKVSGQPYAAYLQDHIFGPLGMKNSGYDSASRIIPKRASGYEPGPNGLTNATPLDMSVPFSAGALYSTVDDLLIWDQALYADKPLGAASEALMFRDEGHHYGFGWSIDDKWGQPRIWHDGGINGFVSSFQRYPKAHVTAVVLSNIMAGAPNKMAADLAGLCLGAEIYPKEVTLPAATLDRYVGYYELSPAAITQIERRGDHLVTHSTGQPETTIYATGERDFYAKIADGTSTFQVDGQGQTTGFVLHLGGPELFLKKIDAAEARRLRESGAP